MSARRPDHFFVGRLRIIRHGPHFEYERWEQWDGEKWQRVLVYESQTKGERALAEELAAIAWEGAK